MAKNSAFKSTLTNVQLIMSVKTGVLAATLDGLYLVDNNGQSTEFYKFQTQFKLCSALIASPNNEQYLLTCTNAQNLIVLNLFNAGTKALLAA